MQIENLTKPSCFDNKLNELDLKENQVDDIEVNHTDLKMESENIEKDVVKCEKINGCQNDENENMTVEDKKTKSVKHENDEKENIVEETDSDITEKENLFVKKENNMDEIDIEKEIKKELKEAVEIRIPKIKHKLDLEDYKWMSGCLEKSNKRPETPPLQKLMRQDFSPLKSGSLSSPSPPKKFKESLSSKEGFTSKLASVIIPSTSMSVPPKTASHPKQLLSHSIANLRTSSMKQSSFSKSAFSHSSYLSRSFPLSQSFFTSAEEEQPLDLSKKPSSKTSHEPKASPKKNGNSRSELRKHENGLSSTSLQSLQQKFGGDFHLRGLRKPLNYMLYGPEIPALHQALLHSASMSLPHFALPMTNGQPKITPEKIYPSRHRNLTPSPSHKSRSDESVKSIKREDVAPVEKSIKRELEKVDVESDPSLEEKQGENYTNHLCTCGKWFDGLYSLSLHLQETGHLPARNKSVSLLEYPKLVRGQDMWLNQESEQTRRILRCIQCGESFKTLPMLTVHMMKTQHYTKIVSSEHARRAHKCSAYCDKEQDKECVFKCKVCQESFSDMEGLANHMIMSGHHKKQSPRPPQSFSELQFKKRKRYSFDESLNPYGNPSMAAMYDYKRHLAGGSASPDLSTEESDDSRINCENCNCKIETKSFVEHVRACLGQKLREDAARIEKENAKKASKDKRNFDKANDEDSDHFRSSEKKRKLENGSSKSNSDSEDEEVKSDVDVESLDDDKDSKSMLDTTDSLDKSKFDKSRDTKESEKSIKVESDSDELELGEIRDNSKNILKEIQTLVDSKSSKRERIENIDKTEVAKNEGEKRSEGSGSKKVSLGKKLDIIDPDHAKEASEGSALSAMESFIKKSFSNKFDYKKGNIIISPHSSSDATIHTRPINSAMSFDTTDYLSRYKNFYAALNLNLGNGFKQGHNEREGSKSKVNSHDVVKKEIRSKLEKGKERLEKSGSPKSEGSEEKDDGRSSVKSGISDASSQLDKNENLETKYLNMDENEEESKVDKEKSSALDNLSSFVYGQNLTSEHPLDSLQRLITKSDIPKLMGTAAASHGFKYLPPHLALHQSSLDLSVPLNLSVKSQNGDSDEDETKSRPDEDSLSDYEALNSPTNSDGEPMEYRCAACSRKFASKGSYRYHLSRCHLSSVKRYGIKEAFNMSPYVYLPLDHTAKFSKYYEMAKELANKAKENRTK
ncbi:teashirt homolog 2-like isoform X2 [Ruditapes philippinarum]|nr:teashirt homolog 2-like isoform X2 [Ruditapes philippinarum]XP_060591563.1 teashirt homolog 2-like isoform X2 [Ruditapes philippinarum]XP_060591564.1 teashirt homolog 2-like isoform X2 [Ruditapes philippinarum]XP_060591565.1 teashirt homolog 2-like isoform X2 [Ruditapes philippinarum]